MIVERLSNWIGMDDFYGGVCNGSGICSLLETGLLCAARILQVIRFSLTESKAWLNPGHMPMVLQLIPLPSRVTRSLEIGIGGGCSGLEAAVNGRPDSSRSHIHPATCNWVARFSVQ